LSYSQNKYRFREIEEFKGRLEGRSLFDELRLCGADEERGLYPFQRKRAALMQQVHQTLTVAKPLSPHAPKPIPELTRNSCHSRRIDHRGDTAIQ
jgi:hypothetical protein